MAKAKNVIDGEYSPDFWTEPPKIVQALFGFFVLTPIFAILSIPFFISSIPIYMKLLPWNFIVTRPHRIIRGMVLVSFKSLREWIATLGYASIFIGRSVSFDTHPRSFQLPYSIRVQFRFLMLFQRYFGMHRCVAFEKHVFGSALEWCKKNPPRPDQVNLKVPIVDPSKITPQEFYEKFVTNPHPVVLRGMNKDSPCCKKWNVDYFFKYASDRAPVTETGESPTVERLTFGEYLDWVKRNWNTPMEKREDPKYLANFANLFNWHPELIDELDVRKMSEWLGPTNNGLLGCHMFIGLKDTATPFHAANTMNWFVQVQGQKKWTFVHPEQSLMVYPIFSHDVFYTGSMMEYPEPPTDVMESDFPLWKYCPRYEIVLEPGDVLLNPSWFWHRIHNVSDITIACATRWRLVPFMDTNLLGDVFLSLCARYWANALTILSKYEGQEAVLTDETTLTMDQRLSRFNQGKLLAEMKRPSVRSGAYTKHPFATLRLPSNASDEEPTCLGAKKLK